MMHNKTEEPSFKEQTTLTTMALILQQILSDRHISQRELAKLSGVTQAMISNIISGKQDPSVTTLTKIATALDIEVPDLFDRQKFKTLECPFCGKRVTVQLDTISHVKVIK